MSKYGEEFDLALNKIVAIKLGRRKAGKIIGGIIVGFGLFLLIGSAISSSMSGRAASPTLQTIATVYLLIGFVLEMIMLFKNKKVFDCYESIVEQTCNIAEYLGDDAKQLKKQFKSKLKAKDRQWILDTTDYYFEKGRQIEQKDWSGLIENNGEGGFDGMLLQKLGWIILGFVITVCTFGIGFPLAYIWVLRWQYKHSLYDGRRLSFDGKALQLVGKWVYWIVLSILTLSVYAFFIPKKLLQWKASHLHIAGANPCLGGMWKGNGAKLILLRIGCALFTLITLWIGKPLAICWKNRYIQKNLIIDGHTISFDGNGAQIIGKWVIWSILTCITLGIYVFFRNLRIYRWINSHTHINEKI